MGAEEGSGAQLGPSPRILVLRESGDVEVDVDLGDRENSPDGSFARTTTHRRISTGSASEEEQEQETDAKASKHHPVQQKGLPSSTGS